MARLVVDTARDIVDAGDGLLSLREAVSRANGTEAADSILFARGLEGRTLVLRHGELRLTGETTIDGDRDDDGTMVVLSGGDASRILAIEGDINQSLDVRLEGLVFQDGRIGSSQSGSAVAAYHANLYVEHAVFRSNAGASTIAIDYGGLRARDTVIDSNLGQGISAYGVVQLHDSSITNNTGSGISTFYSTVDVANSTIANNLSSAGGGAIDMSNGPGWLTLYSSTITGNRASAGADGGGLLLNPGVEFRLANSIVAGNAVLGGGVGPDLAGTITLSNGHNVLGSDVAGDVAGDREGIAAGAIFATIDPATGGGQLDGDLVAVLRVDVANPALAGADRLLSRPTDQLGAERPAPKGTNPDIGAVESGSVPSPVASDGNDALTLTAAADMVDALAGNDTVVGLAGDDTLHGGAGGDYLEGGAGDDILDGGSGIDLVSYRDARTAVVVDLRGSAPGDTDTARRGSEIDRMTGVEGAIGGSGDDTFYGDASANHFHGGGGSDLFFGGAGADRFDYDRVSGSVPGSRRDVIADYEDVDIVDLSGIDADTTRPGDQAFRWVDEDPLTGAAQIGYVVRGNSAIIRASVDGDAAVEFELRVDNVGSAPLGDFIL